MHSLLIYILLHFVWDSNKVPSEKIKYTKNRINIEFESIWGFECYFHYFSFTVDFDKGKQKIRRPLSINTAKAINQPKSSSHTNGIVRLPSLVKYNFNLKGSDNFHTKPTTTKHYNKKINYLKVLCVCERKVQDKYFN